MTEQTPSIRRVKLQGKYQELQSGKWDRIVPWLNVSGLWLEQAGFKSGGPVEITVQDKTLIITKLAGHGDHRD